MFRLRGIEFPVFKGVDSDRIILISYAQRAGPRHACFGISAAAYCLSYYSYDFL